MATRKSNKPRLKGQHHLTLILAQLTATAEIASQTPATATILASPKDARRLLKNIAIIREWLDEASINAAWAVKRKVSIVYRSEEEMPF